MIPLEEAYMRRRVDFHFNNGKAVGPLCPVVAASAHSPGHQWNHMRAGTLARLAAPSGCEEK